MYLVNRHGRVVELDEQMGQEFLASGNMREASDGEIANYLARRQAMNENTAHANTVYFQTVKASADGYGMSRDHIKFELAQLGIVLAETYADQKIGILYNYPYGVISMRTDVRIIFSMFESDKLPEDWADYLNMADEVLVPSKWCQDVFAESGVKSTVVPLGYNDRGFVYIERPIPIESKKPFTFIHYDSFNVRKGWQEVWSAFTAEFGPDEPVKLILKTAQSAVKIPVIKSQYPNVEVITGNLPEKELIDLLARSNCMVYPSRGEGFGITPLEAMATGLPAIVPNAHGISEYFNANYMLEVKVAERCPGLYSRFKNQDVGEMVICDEADLRKQMRYAFNNQQEMKELGQSASEYAKNYTYRRTADRLLQVIKKWQATDVLKRNESKYLQVERV